MTDREMLEFSAKAAGIGTLVWGDRYKLGDDEIDCTDIPYIRSGQPDESDVFWNPITDDGDALRLAVKLRMSLDTALGQSLAIPLGGKDCVEQHADDPYAATRRAIVRAAAEIGRQMP
jgi:hypothetical protein